MHSPSLEFLLLLLFLLLIHRAMTAGSRGKGAIGSGGKAATGPGGSGVMSGGGPGGAFAAGRFSACGGGMESECNDSAAGERLVKRVLLCGYDRTSRPVRNDSTTTRVNVAVSLFHILDTVSGWGRAVLRFISLFVFFFVFFVCFLFSFPLFSIFVLFFVCFLSLFSLLTNALSRAEGLCLA